MKRYLISGAMALAFCSMFVGCSDDDEWMSYADAKVQAFDEAFTKIYGQIDPRQDWGFGNYATTRAANTEHNQWAAVDNIYKLLVPPALTDGQKQRVKIYFQYNRYLTYEDPHLTDFFVQQVYKGSTNPGALSSEVYTSGNGASVKAGDHMDKLTVGVAETHVNDFNSADCGESTVLNNGTKQNDYVPDGTTHQDKITLMLGESTEYVGFWCSEGSVQHNDCCALAGADVIDAWATSDAVKAWAQENNIDLGEAVVDGWDRSFVGLDYEQMKPDDCFTSKWYWNGSANVEKTTVNVWDFCSDTNNTKKVKLNGQLVDASTVANDQLFFPNGQPVKWVNDNTNMYLGQNLGTTQNTFNKEENGVKYYDLDAVYACINQGAYPKQNNMEFIKGLGGRDYVFSDWIVTLTPAKKQNLQKGNVLLVKEEDGEYTGTVEYWRKGSVKSGRIFVEDLARADLSDIDFNDAVFDAYIYDVEVTKKMFKSDESEIGTMRQGPDKYTTIDILACGGTLPLTVAGTEVHSLYGQSTTTMINTIGKNSVLNTSQGYQDHEVKTIAHAPYYESLAAIPVVVKYDKDVMVLNNKDLGKVPHMICVPIGTPWPQERVAIGPEVSKSNTSDCAFPLFAQYVGNASIDPWGNYNVDKVYEWNITPETPSDIDEMYIQKDTVYTGSIVSEDSVEVEQAIPTPTGTLVGSKYPHQMKNGKWSTPLVLSAQELQSAGVAGGKKLRIYGVGYNGEDIKWQLYIYGLTSDWINATNTPSLATKGYIEFDITDSNLNTFNSGITIQGEAFNILAVTVVEASQQ